MRDPKKRIGVKTRQWKLLATRACGYNRNHSTGIPVQPFIPDLEVSRMELHVTHTWYVETATDHRPCPPFTIYVPSLRASLDLADLLRDRSRGSVSWCPLSNLHSRSKVLGHPLLSYETWKLISIIRQRLIKRKL